MTDLWGYIHINANAIPERLTQGPFLHRGWTEYTDRRGFWLPCGEEPGQTERSALKCAWELEEVQSYHIVSAE